MNFIKPKKSLGQHFLTDKNIAKKIIESLKPKTKNVLEIGPGTGVLTSYLIKKNYNLILVEIDHESVDFLINSLLVDEKIIIKKDFLKLDLPVLFSGKNFSIIGNFPYNISSQILFKVFENKEIIYEMIGMFQYEVAERICSNKGTKKYGILSVLIQAFFSVELLIKIKPESFNPPPKVTSAVIRIIKVRDNIDCDEILFKQIIKSAFNQRRKTLRNSLKSFKKIENIKEHSIFDKRAEELDVDDYIFLTNLLSNGNI